MGGKTVDNAQIQEVIQGLQEWGHLTSIQQVASRAKGRPLPAATLRGVRKSSNGIARYVIVEVFDRGPRYRDTRYYCEAKPEGQPKSSRVLATGNPEPSIEIMLSTTHWHELDM